MSNPTKVWHLCPTFDMSPPPDGPVVLGSIVKSKTHLRAPINGQEKPPKIPDTMRIETSELTKTKHTVSRTKDTSFSLFAKIAEICGFGGSAGMNFNDASSVEYHFEKETTTRFEPDAAFLRLATDSEAVKTFRSINGTGPRKPVYMVTGLKCVDGATMRTVIGKKRGAKADVEADATSSGVPLKIGAKGERSTTADETHSTEGSTPFVFCVHLKKIWWDRKGTMNEDDEHRGTWMGKDAGGEEDLLASEDTVNEFRKSAVVTLESEDQSSWELVY